LGILHIRLKVVYTLYIVPTGLAGLAGFLSIDIMSYLKSFKEYTKS